MQRFSEAMESTMCRLDRAGRNFGRPAVSGLGVSISKHLPGEDECHVLFNIIPQ